MKYPFDLLGPRHRRRPVAVALSTLAHVAGILVLVMWWRQPETGSHDTQLIVLAPTDRPLEAPVEYVERRKPPARSLPPRFEVEPEVIRRAGAAVFSPVLRGGGVPGGVGSGGFDGVLAAGELRPTYQSGHLWVPPLPLTPEEIAERLQYLVSLGSVGSGNGAGGGDGTGGGGGGVLDPELIDSAVTAIVQGYLDSVASEPGADLQQLPSWTTDIAGLDFGIDQSWIYFAGLKIPAAVLALLPLPRDRGNYFRDREWAWMMDVRRDIYYSAWIADTKEEFKENVRKLRERREHEYQLARNQRLAPVLVQDSVGVDTTGGEGERERTP